MHRSTIIFFVLISLQLSSRPIRMTLQQALDKKMVTAQAFSNGSYKNYCMNLTLSNLTKDSLTIEVLPGWRFNSINDQEQDILIVKQETILLNKSEQKNTLLKGFCCQASNHAPSANARYLPGKLADSNLVKLARFLNKGDYAVDTEQQAVWAISDNRPLAYISDSTESLVTLRYFVAGILGVELPWYSIEKKTFVYSNGVIATFPTLLRGTLNYSHESTDYVTCTILDINGRPVGQISSGWLSSGVNQKYDLKLPVKDI
jgi:hypothetical protein